MAKTNILSIVVAIAALFALATAISGYFWFAKDGGLHQRSGDAVGSVIRLKNDVRFKSGTEFKWQPATPKMNVLEMDQFFAGNDSEVRIQLLSGEEILLQSNSLIVVKTRGSNFEIHLALGSAKIFRGKRASGLPGAKRTVFIISEKPLEIATFNENLESLGIVDQPAITSEPFLIEEPEGSEDATITEIRVQGPSSPQEIQEKLELSKMPEPLPEKKYAFQAINDVQVRTVRSPAKEFEKGNFGKAIFHWQKPKDSVGAYQVSIKQKSSDKIRSFATNDEKFEFLATDASEFEVSIEANREISTLKPTPKNRLLKVTLPKPDKLDEAVLNTPSESQVFILSEGATLSIPLRVQAFPSATEYRIQISQDPGFKSPFELSAKDSELSLEEQLPPGRHFIRAKVLTEFGISPWSRPVSFMVMAP